MKLLVICLGLVLSVIPASAQDAFIPAFPSTPPAGWTTGEGYDEPRGFVEAQWHEAPEGDFDHARHFHLGAAVPRKVSGIFRLDLRVVAFHQFGGRFMGIRKALIRVPGGTRRYLPAPVKSDKPGLYSVPLTEHVHEFYIPLYLDTRLATEDGIHLMEIDASMLRADGRTANVRLQVPVYLENGIGEVTDPTTGEPLINSKTGAVVVRTLVNRGGMPAVEGWISNTAELVSPFGYLRTAVRNVRRFDTDPATEPLEVRAQGKLDRTIESLVTINPDLHKHPPAYGTVIVDQSVVMGTSGIGVTLGQPPLVPGDRLMFRTADTTGGEAGASLLVVTLGTDVK